MGNTTINQSRPIHDENGNVILDYEFCGMALDKIDTYENQNHKPAPINPKFVTWLREGEQYVKTGKGTFADYKERYVLKEYASLYEQIIDNTNKQNANLDKQGKFNSKVMQVVKGESNKK